MLLQNMLEYNLLAGVCYKDLHCSTVNVHLLWD